MLRHSEHASSLCKLCPEGSLAARGTWHISKVTVIVACSLLQSAQVLQRLSCATLFAFTAIMFREVLMDCSDEKGGPEFISQRSSMLECLHKNLPSTGISNAWLCYHPAARKRTDEHTTYTYKTYRNPRTMSCVFPLTMQVTVRLV